MQGDVSFTILDRIEEVELNTEDRRWQPALALTLPDICGERCWQRRCEYLHQKLQSISEKIMLSYIPESAKTKLGKHKPDLWIVTEDMMDFYVIISQKDLLFLGIIEVLNLKGEQGIGKKSGKC